MERTYIKSTKKKSAIDLINYRQKTANCSRGLGKLVLRKLIESTGRYFKEVWNKTSPTTIMYDGYLYYSNFRVWYGGCFLCDGTPHLLFNKSSRSGNWRIEDAVRFESPATFTVNEHTKAIDFIPGHSPCLLALTSDDWLVRYTQSPTWKVEERIYLSDRYHFKHITWGSNMDTFVLKSIRFCGPCSMIRDPARNSIPQIRRNKPLLYLSIFQNVPLKFIVNFGVVKSVWGDDLIDANISHGMFVTIHRKDVLKFYDLESIIYHHRTRVFDIGEEIVDDADLIQYFSTLGQMRNLSRPLEVGRYPLGIPVNLTKAEKPPVLLQLSTCQSIVSFGGFPWRAIVAQCREGNLFNVCNIRSRTVDAVINTGHDPDCHEGTYFHEDNSGRILSIGRQSLSCLSLKEGNAEGALQVCNFKIDVSEKMPDVENYYSHSGRSVKLRRQLSELSDENIILDIDYDDELDIIVVLSSDYSASNCQGHVGLYDNCSGSVIREFTFKEQFDDSDLWSVYIDRDVIFCICRKISSGTKHYCKLFRLSDKQ